MKTNKLIISAVMLVISCAPDEVDRKWDNNYMNLYPARDSLEVRNGREEFHWEKRGENFDFKIVKKGDSATVSITDLNNVIHFGWFDGFKIKGSEEIDWNYSKDGKTITATHLFLDGYESYEASISRDKHKR